MDGFDTIFHRATVSISPEYFQLPIVGGSAVFRERVYCYELYHQLRLLWPRDSGYRLNGEVDKRSHPYFVENDWAPKPDFIVHAPGSNDNYLVIEVKTVDGLTTKEVLKDLHTLARFRAEAGYRRAIHLAFGSSGAATLNLLRRAELDASALGGIEFWGHPEPRRPAERAA
jgi:hypothetical protein